MGCCLSPPPFGVGSLALTSLTASCVQQVQFSCSEELNLGCCLSAALFLVFLAVMLYRTDLRPLRICFGLQCFSTLYEVFH